MDYGCSSQQVINHTEVSRSKRAQKVGIIQLQEVNFTLPGHQLKSLGGVVSTSAAAWSSCHSRR